jgi:hypothetical protein
MEAPLPAAAEAAELFYMGVKHDMCQRQKRGQDSLYDDLQPRLLPPFSALLHVSAPK